MKLNNLLEKLNDIKVINYKNIEISDITLNANEINNNSLLFLTSAEAKRMEYSGNYKDLLFGAIIAKKELPISIPQIITTNLRKDFAVISKRFYNNASDKLQIIMITGTNGKTTTAHFVKEIFSLLNEEIGEIGTFGGRYKDCLIKTGMTTPDPNALHKIFDKFVGLGCKTVVMEASAHAIYLNKLYGITPKIVALTNCSRDHLDFFVTEENYKNAKKALFYNYQAEKIIVNSDDPLGKEILKDIKSASFGTYDADYTFKANCSGNLNVDVKTPKGEYSVSNSLIGEFNAYNEVCAAAIAVSYGFNEDEVFRALNSLKSADGRLEKIENQFGINIFVDFAHTPSALSCALTELKKITANQLICVFGCGGNRDKGKRELMGEVSANLADFTVVTSDNPRSEDPLEIINQITKGLFRAKGRFTAISGRRSAIEYAINTAKNGDTILVAGKGDEDYMEIGSVKYPYRDKDEIEDILSKKIR